MMRLQFPTVQLGKWRVVPGLLLLALAGSLLAQSQPQPPEPGLNSEQVIAQVTVSLPGKEQIAMALATPVSRRQVLLNLATAVNVLQAAHQNPAAEQAVLAQQFLDDRAWLQRLVKRYGWARPHSAVLDPAAWSVLNKIQQYEPGVMTLVAPDRMPIDALLSQVFQRSDERLAAANLPILLLQVEADALHQWDSFVQLADANGRPHAAWKDVESAWFDDRQTVTPLDLDNVEDGRGLAPENALEMLSLLVLNTTEARPPDQSRLVQVRYLLLNRAFSLPADKRQRARDALQLANLIDGLHEARYLNFVQGLVAVTFSLLEQFTESAQAGPLVVWLVAELPAVSAHYARGFASVDPRLNAVMAIVYGVVHGLSQPATETVDIGVHKAALADAVAQLSLMIPDMSYYFDAPVRMPIERQIQQCIDLATSQDEAGLSTMTRRQFDNCMETLSQLAERETRTAELSGNIRGPFTTEALNRELSVLPWQRLNYAIGYLHQHRTTTCRIPEEALPNPLEWAVLVNVMVWLAENFPDFFNSPENESRLARVHSMGEQLTLDLVEQADCFAGEEAGNNDLITWALTNHELALRKLNTGMAAAEADFRLQKLRPGADIVLGEGAAQKTAYRPDDLLIEPCNRNAVCEMSGALPATRALIGLFPEQYLVAAQSGMGEIEICYRNMEWVERRSELVRPDDENVANYFGKLGFDLVGRYQENGKVSDIFAYRFTSPQEHHYLFAQASAEVLADSCPVEWVGSRVVTELRENRRGIVPNRLTYLAAARNVPSRLLQNNWNRGAEWRDWFVTGIGVSALEVPAAPDIISRLDLHLQTLYQAEQAEIYQRLLLRNARNSVGDNVSLFDEMSEVSTTKALLRLQMMLFYPDSLLSSDAIRGAITGDDGLLEGRTLRRFREDNVALTSVNQFALQRLRQLQAAWSEQPEAVRRNVSLPSSLMHAQTRLDSLYKKFFSSQPDQLEELEVNNKTEER